MLRQVLQLRLDLGLDVLHGVRVRQVVVENRRGLLRPGRLVRRRGRLRGQRRVAQQHVAQARALQDVAHVLARPPRDLRRVRIEHVDRVQHALVPDVAERRVQPAFIVSPRSGGKESRAHRHRVSARPEITVWKQTSMRVPVEGMDTTVPRMGSSFSGSPVDTSTCVPTLQRQ